MAETIDFKFGKQLGFAKAHLKSHPEEKWARPWARGIPKKYLGFPFNICATAEASNFKFGMQLGFARPTIKPHPEEKWAWPWAMGVPKYLGFSFNISAKAALSS